MSEITAGASAGAPIERRRQDLYRQRLAGRPTARPDAPAAERTGPVSLSFGQEQMWFLNRLDPAGSEYLVPVVQRMQGPLDPSALGRALDALLARHPILRTRYLLQDGRPVQVADPPGTLPLPTTDLAPVVADPSQRLRYATELADAEAVRPFDLDREWPVRAGLLRLAADDHLFVLVFHHIAYDAWSGRVLARELATAYSAYRSGREVTWPAPAVPYADYARRQRDAPPREADDDYWRARLAGLTRVDLPTDRPRPPIRSSAGAAITLTVPAEIGSALRELALAHRSTLFTAVLTAFQVLLARYSGHNDVATATVVSGRTRPQWQEMVGYTLNTLVMRASWSPAASFANLLTQARGDVLDAFDHQETPFARLVDALAPDRDPSRMPLAQTAVMLADRDEQGWSLPGVQSEPVRVRWRISRFDLSLLVTPGPDGELDIQFEYATALFDADTVHRIGGHFRRLLAAAVADPDRPVEQIDIIGTDEAARLAPVLRPGPANERRLDEIFADQARATPDAPAVTRGEESLTYAQLEARANRVAAHLRRRGAGPGRLVGLHLEPGPDLLAVLIGVLKSGAAYLPIDPATPTERRQLVVADAGLDLVVTDTAAQWADWFTGDLLIAADLTTETASPVTGFKGHPDDPAYVIYTSGSTGRPKGVLVSHRNVVRLLAGGRELLHFGPDDVWALAHSVAFDVSVWEIWGALLHGGRLVVVPPTVLRSPEEFLDLLAEQRMTILNQTPSAFRTLAATVAAGHRFPQRTSLRAVVFAGERLEPAELRPWVRRIGLDRVALVNLYGITETTVHSTFHRIVEADLTAPLSPIGRELDDLRIEVLDAGGWPAPLGVSGDLHVAGAGVALGYLNRPALTADRFGPDPAGPPGSRRYRSGDLARRRPDGTLEFRGRRDDQVKIRGYRVEPGEVVAAVLAHPGVREAAVIVRPGHGGAPQLVAYYVPADPDTSDTPVAPLRAAVAEALPPYMVPAAFVRMDRLPTTTNGKLDRTALPAPDARALGVGDDAQAPRTAIEERLAAAWRTVLGTDRIGVHDNFFERGGDSIRVVALVGELRASGLDVSVRDILEHRTISAVAERLDQRPEPAAVRPVAAFELINARDRAAVPADVVDAYPLLQTQVGMLIDLLARNGRNNYHNVACFRVREDVPFSENAFRSAARVVAERHEALRTSVHLSGYSVPMSLVHDHAQIPVVVRDLRGQDERDREQALADFAEQEKQRLFDVERPPLLRLAAHLDDDGWWLITTEYHAVHEGWSYHSLLMEVLDCYRQVRDGEPVPEWTAPPVRFADSVAAELRSLAAAGDRAYWRDLVTAYPPLTLPPAWAAPPGTARTDYQVAVRFDDLDDGLRRLAGRAGTGLKSVLVAAHLTVMSTLSTTERFQTGLVAHGRPEAPGADRVYGMHLNTLPFPAERPSGTWTDLVRTVLARESEVWAHRHFPMPAVQREFGAGQRLIRVLLNYIDFYQLDAERLDLAATRSPGTTEYDLAVTTLAGRIGLKTNTTVLSRDAADRLAAMYRAVLEAMADDPDGPARPDRLSPGERDRLLAVSTAPTSPVTGTVVAEFERRASEQPTATALRSGTEEITYATLDGLAGRLARYLEHRGVTADSVVGVFLDRGPGLVVSLLAVLKAGAAYSPLDPQSPPERVGRLLAGVAASVIITDAGRAEAGLGGFTGPVVRIDADADQVAAQPVGGPTEDLDLDRLAYVIHTSGSTGTPKGVAVTHRGLANHVRWAAAELIGSSATGTGSALFSSAAHDLVVPVIYAPLVSGRTLTLLPAELDLADLGQTLVAGGPYDFLKLTPAHLDILTGQLTAAQAAGLTGTLLVAGEALSRRTVIGWRRLAPSMRMINEYGPTEATVGTSIHPVDAARAPDPVPIGRPLPGMSMIVLGADVGPAPAGVVGELYVGGVGMARGYHRQPRLTADRFRPDPFGAPGARRYRTGDRAWVALDGTVTFVGRGDDQVKIHGHRIEPGEIEAALAALPGVAGAAVVPVGGPGGMRLAGYVVLADKADKAGQTADSTAGIASAGAVASRLRERLADLLPPALRPSSLVVLDRFPLTDNGKLDRAGLAARSDPSAPARSPVAARTVTEQRIAALWGHVLGLDPVDVEASFFDVGGDSLSAVALVGALRETGFDLSVRDVFDHRTVAALAVSVTGRPAAVPVPSVLPFALVPAEDRAGLPDDLVDAYPVSQVQLGMVADQLTDGTVHRYHSVTSYRIADDQPFSIAALRAAAAAVAARHESLRTSFHLFDASIALQHVHAHVEIPLVERSLVDLDRDGRRQALAEFTRAERSAVFDLSAAPLLRLAAHVEEGTAWWLTTTRCHAVTEGWSHFSLVTELLELYHRLRDGLPVPDHQPPAVRYADFVAAELGSLQSTHDRDYWTRVVTGRQRLRLPAGLADGSSPPGEPHRVRVSLTDLDADLRALARQARVSLKTVLLTAHLTVMSRLADADGFHTGLVCDARPEVVGADRVYGMYLNTVPFPARRPTGPWLDELRRTFDTEVGLWPHRRFPLPAIQRLTGAAQLLDVSFNYLDFPQVDTTLVDVDETIGAAATGFGLAVTTLAGVLTLSTTTATMSRAAAQRLGAAYRDVLEQMVRDPQAHVAGLPDAERADLHRLGQGPSGTTPPTTLTGLFAAQVRAAPQAPAVITSAGTISYTELDERSTRLARHLRELGACTGTTVAISLPRGVDLVVALLGTLKAGAAYLPLDPTLPRRRRHTMLDQARPAVVIDGALPSTDKPHRDPTRVPEGVPDPGDPAYVIFTSGSTGTPKAVVIEHAAIANRVRWGIRAQGLRPTDRVLLRTSLSFDAAGWEIFGPLSCGAAIVPAPAGAERDPATLLRAIAALKVSVLQVVPSILRLLVDEPAWPRTRLRVISCAGERLDAALAERARRSPDVELWNTYGPTECAIDVTAHRYDPQEPGPAVPIGRPIDATLVVLLDRHGDLAPLGMTGHLHVGGPGVAAAYLGRPELTADRFGPDPWGPPGARLYRTGDLARWRPDGALEFVARADRQIKINGVRIEPAEVERALTATPGVQQALVAGRPGSDGNARLVAYLVPSGSHPPRPAELRMQLAETLPPVMVPTAFVPLAQFPLTASGKLDLDGLPDPAEHPGSGEYPRTGTESTLADLYSRVLGVDQVGRDTDFFAAGGDSLLVIRLIARARDTGLALTLRMLHEHTTLAALAAHLDADPEPAAVSPEAAAVSVEPAARTARRPLRSPAAVMAARHVPGTSVAVLADGEVVEARGFGTTEADGGEPVAADTPFQAASISKHVTVLAVLRLVGEGQLDLDVDVHEYLRSWWIPGGTGAAVTLRHLLNHRAGLNHVPSVNYRPDAAVPTLLDILHGRPPAPGRAVQAERDPELVFRKTNINFSVVEQILVDVTGRPFPALMRELVLEPLGMRHSGFEQDFPARCGRPVAIGHDETGRPIPGRWRIRPETAAGGLWSTALDLAQVAAEVRRARLGSPAKVLAPELAAQLLTVGHPGSFYGLGTVVDDSAPDPEFGHSGRTVGYRVMTISRVHSGSGFVVLTNGEGGKDVIGFVSRAASAQAGASAPRDPAGALAERWRQGRDEPVEPARPIGADLEEDE